MDSIFIEEWLFMYVSNNDKWAMLELILLEFSSNNELGLELAKVVEIMSKNDKKIDVSAFMFYLFLFK